MTHRDIWEWEECKNDIAKLRGRLGFPNTAELSFLRLKLSLTDGRVHDDLKQEYLLGNKSGIYCLLSGYASSNEVAETGELISYAQLRGGRAFHRAFVERAVKPIAKRIGHDSSLLKDAGDLLKGQKLSYGDYSVCIRSLPLVPVTIILWTKSPEFAARAKILFDSSAGSYLSTEELAILGQLTSSRIISASEYLKKE
ncbi:MAG: DUF3786 domain-containing protein [Candidatus Heimdallarchaeota archaeon]